MITNFLIENLIKRTYNGMTYALPDSVYLGLLTEIPTPVNPTGVELIAANYSRVLLTAKLGIAVNNSISNTGRIEFPQALAQWGPIVGLGIYSRKELGSLLDHYAFVAPLTIDEEYALFWDPGTFSLSWLIEDNAFRPKFFMFGGGIMSTIQIYDSSVAPINLFNQAATIL